MIPRMLGQYLMLIVPINSNAIMTIKTKLVIEIHRNFLLIFDVKKVMNVQMCKIMALILWDLSFSQERKMP